MNSDQPDPPILSAGMLIPAGDRFLRVSPELAAAYRPGDSLIPVSDALLHVPGAQRAIVAAAIDRAVCAFEQMARIDDAAITRFYEAFARRLEDDEAWGRIAEANAADVASARARGRSTTRLEAGAAMRRGMIAGLRQWRDAFSQRDRVIETIEHDGWRVEQVVAPLGVVGFVFEGRPNVFADATGVLRGGNTAVFRIGSDALGTAEAIVAHALRPALEQSGLPEGAATLVSSAERAAGWALFSDRRLSLAVARGSGAAVAQLGSVARAAGIPVSLHGTGGAWLVADESADGEKLGAAVERSLDRKVCNTLNVCCLPSRRAGELVPIFLRALARAGERRGHGFKLHIVAGDEGHLPPELFATRALIKRAEGDVLEPVAERLPIDELAREWEWEGTPEVSLKIVDDLDEAIRLFNQYSPQFIAGLIAESPAAHQHFYRAVNAPFVGNGFTRWVDGQYALDRPELGLSNWQNGRLFARGGILSGDGVYTVRTRAVQSDPDLRR